MWCVLFCTSALISVINCKFDPSIITGSNTNEEEAREYITYYDKESSKRCYRTTKAKWEAMINPTEEAGRELEEAQKDSGEFELKAWKTITSYAWDKFSDGGLKRWFTKAATFGDAALPRQKLARVGFRLLSSTVFYRFSSVSRCQETTARKLSGHSFLSIQSKCSG